MIEVLPERLLVQFLKGFQGKAKKVTKPFRPQPQQTPYRPSPHKPTPKPVQKPQNPYRDPTYHPVGMSGDDKLQKPPWG